jgi:hypothetical protein
MYYDSHYIVLYTIKDFKEWRPQDLQMMAIGNLRNQKSPSSHRSTNIRYWGGTVTLKQAKAKDEKKKYVPFCDDPEMRLRREFIAQKYIERKFIIDSRTKINPWSFHPLRSEEIEVLELNLERPDDA